MRVLKFGGTSVADGPRIVHVAGLVARTATRERCVVVVSALAGVTDALVAAAGRAAAGDEGREAVASLRARHLACLAAIDPRAGDAAEGRIEARLTALARSLAGSARRRRCPPQVRDEILAAGERISVVLLAAALGALGTLSEVVDGAEAIATDASFGEAAVDMPRTVRMAGPRFAKVRADAVPVVAGFIGSDPRGRTTTLGRGGSDYSASLLGAALGASGVEIWTDVDGVLSAPPRLVPDAVTVPRLDYREAGELARLGGKVLHPKTMQPLAELGIPIFVRNTFAPDAAGTLITASGNGRRRAVRAVTAVEDAVLLTIEGPEDGGPGVGLGSLPVEPLFVQRVSGALAVVTRGSDAGVAERALAREANARMTVHRRRVGVIAAVGEPCTAAVAERFAATLAKAKMPVIGVSRASSRTLCAAVEPREVGRITRLLHRELIDAGDPPPAVGVRAADLGGPHGRPEARGRP